MKLISWNIQWCLGVDGRVDPERIVDHAKSMADFDVLCLQEVARNYPALKANDAADQFARLASLLPGYTAIEGIAVDDFSSEHGRREFGNMILTRLPVITAFRHLLPWPADPLVPSMQRIALEAVLKTARGPLRVTTSHLEFYSERQREAQVARLRELQAEATGHAKDTLHEEKHGGPFETRRRGPSGVLCGDFNYEIDEPIHSRLQAPIEDPRVANVPRYVDAWTLAHPDKPHDPTVGLFDKEQWHNRQFCCDVICVTEDIAARVVDVRVNLETSASDHQPVLLELAD